jgi:hypothetical protein
MRSDVPFAEAYADDLEAGDGITEAGNLEPLPRQERRR